LSEDQLRIGKARLKWYKERDENKIKTDIAKNDFESMIYKLKDFLNEDENHKYIEEVDRLIYIETLSELEEWLYDEGDGANYTVYNNKAKNLTDDYNKYNNLKSEH
jgi:molecular chaperone DnaK (HSP70)